MRRSPKLRPTAWDALVVLAVAALAVACALLLRGGRDRLLLLLFRRRLRGLHRLLLRLLLGLRGQFLLQQILSGAGNAVLLLIGHPDLGRVATKT